MPRNQSDGGSRHKRVAAALAMLLRAVFVLPDLGIPYSNYCPKHCCTVSSDCTLIKNKIKTGFCTLVLRSPLPQP